MKNFLSLILLLFCVSLCEAQEAKFKVLDKDINTSVSDFRAHLDSLGYMGENPVVTFSGREWTLSYKADPSDSIHYVFLEYRNNSNRELSDYFEKLKRGFETIYGKPFDNIDKKNGTMFFYYGNIDSTSVTLGYNSKDKYIGAYYLRTGTTRYKELEKRKKAEDAIIERKSKEIIQKARKNTLQNIPDHADGLFFLSYNKLINSMNDKDFIVVNAEGKNSNEIKNDMLSSLASMFKSPSNAIKTIGDNIVVVNAISDQILYNAEKSINYLVQFQYSLQIEIREGRIKINIPTLRNIKEITMPKVARELVRDHYNDITEGTLFYDLSKNMKAQIAFEETFNVFIRTLAVELNKTSEDW